MTSPIPSPSATDSTGLPDSSWITRLRRALRDQPTPVNDTWVADGVGGVFGAGAAPFMLSRGPIYDPDSSVLANYVKVRDTTASVDYAVITSGTPTATQVLLDYDARTLTFATAPTTGHAMAFGYYYCKWRDQDMSDALYAGLRQMFPSVGKVYIDTSISISALTWDYALPSWAQSPDATISLVEYQDPFSGVEPWRPVRVWDQRGSDILHLPQAQRLSPAARLRITGWGPYLSLGDLPPDLYNLPIWYAGSVLLPWQESKRIREDTMVPMTQAGGQQPGLLTQTGDYYAKRFDAELKQKSRAYGAPGSARPIVTQYELANYS